MRESWDSCNVFGSWTAGWMEMPFLSWRILGKGQPVSLWIFRWIMVPLLICLCSEMALWSWMFYSLFMLFPFQIGDSSLKTATRSLLEFNTTETCKQNTNHKIQTSITFLCGKTLVSPHSHFVMFFPFVKNVCLLDILTTVSFREE